MKRSFYPAVLEMMDRPQPVSAELERGGHKICARIGFAARIFPQGRRLHFDGVRLSRTNDPLRCATFRRSRIFLQGIRQTSATSRLAKFWAQEISVCAPGNLAGMTLKLQRRCLRCGMGVKNSLSSCL